MKRRLCYCLLFGASQVAFTAGAQVDFRNEVVSQEIVELSNWIVSTGDHARKPFIMVDKINAKAYVFDHFGNFFAASPVLLGLTKGDDVSVGLGALKLSSILPSQRVTPAGRFKSQIDFNSREELVLWVDFDSGIALHPVATAVPSERRVERLESPTTADNRITYGCINVPAKFYKSVVMPEFVGLTGIVYVLPEMQANSLAKIFGQGVLKFHH